MSELGDKDFVSQFSKGGFRNVMCAWLISSPDLVV